MQRARSLLLSLASQSAAIALATWAAGQTVDAPAAVPADGPSYLVTELPLEYIDPNPQFPAPADMANTRVELGRVADGIAAPRADTPLVSFRLADLPGMGLQRIYASGLRAIDQQLVFEFNRRDFHAIVVSPLPDDVERGTRRDLRPQGQTRLRLGVYAGRVKDLRTFATGEEFEGQSEKLDRPEHAWIREDSPIQPNTDQDLVRKDQLDAYLARLNRQPARRVDAEISPARTAGGVNLDYMVAESKPWWVYAQVEDTGTEETTELRERFGFVHSQLLKRDDVLQLDYITGDFDKVNAVVGSYEAPWKRGGRLRGRVYGSYSQYDASVLGFPDVFNGKQSVFGAQLIANVFQHEELFLDTLVGLQWENVDVTNDLGGTQESEDFALGVFGARLQRLGLTSSLGGELTALHNFSGLAGTNADKLQLLGRLGVDEDDFTVLRWDFDFGFFLEPLFSPRSWRDPAALQTKSLAHEIQLSFSGQNSLGDRLIPQQELVAGGLYTVRGYPEAAAVGDNLEIVSAEYRVHLPRLLKPGGQPKRLPVLGGFRSRPQYLYTFPDWDLMLKAFVDYAHVVPEDPDIAELTEDLLGVGVGMELHVLRYLSARVDYGVALKDVVLADGKTHEKGDDEVHFSITLLY